MLALLLAAGEDGPLPAALLFVDAAAPEPTALAVAALPAPVVVLLEVAGGILTGLPVMSEV